MIFQEKTVSSIGIWFDALYRGKNSVQVRVDFKIKEQHFTAWYAMIRKIRISQTVGGSGKIFVHFSRQPLSKYTCKFSRFSDVECGRRSAETAQNAEKRVIFGHFTKNITAINEIENTSPGIVGLDLCAKFGADPTMGRGP